jgi:hypothetical protein
MWRVKLDFVTRFEDDDTWDEEDGGHVEVFQFETEEEARALHDEAKRVIDQGWGEDDQPSADQLDFPKRHKVILRDLDGRADSTYTPALVGILKVERYEDLTDQWRDECGSAS